MEDHMPTGVETRRSHVIEAVGRYSNTKRLSRCCRRGGRRGVEELGHQPCSIERGQHVDVLSR